MNPFRIVLTIPAGGPDDDLARQVAAAALFPLAKVRTSSLTTAEAGRLAITLDVDTPAGPEHVQKMVRVAAAAIRPLVDGPVSRVCPR